jgi:hypothetical protein
MTGITEIIWFVGTAVELPSKPMVTNHEVLKGYFFLRNVKKLPGPKCITNLVDRIHGESETVGFLTLQKCTIRGKLQQLLAEYDQLKRNRNAGANWQKIKENSFSGKLNEYFKCFSEFPLDNHVKKTSTSTSSGRFTQKEKF